LVAPDGRILIEVEPSDVDEQLTARLEHPDGRRGLVFPWARMGTAALLRAVTDSGLHVAAQWRHADRAFVCVATRPARHASVAKTDITQQWGCCSPAGLGDDPAGPATCALAAAR
jgi:hypothetical protein